MKKGFMKHYFVYLLTVACILAGCGTMDYEEVPEQETVLSETDVVGTRPEAKPSREETKSRSREEVLAEMQEQAVSNSDAIIAGYELAQLDANEREYIRNSYGYRILLIAGGTGALVGAVWFNYYFKRLLKQYRERRVMRTVKAGTLGAVCGVALATVGWASLPPVTHPRPLPPDQVERQEIREQVRELLWGDRPPH